MCICDTNNSSYPKMKLGLFLQTFLNQDLLCERSLIVRGILLTFHSQYVLLECSNTPKKTRQYFTCL